jgi:hypothetical protein
MTAPPYQPEQKIRIDYWIYAITIILMGWIALSLLIEAAGTYFALGGFP